MLFRLIDRCIGMALILATGGLGCQTAMAASLPVRQPGLWQSTTYVTLPDGTKARNGAPIVTVSCVDPATDLKFFTINASRCKSLNISNAGPHYAIDGACAQDGKPVAIHTVLTYPDAGTVELNGTIGTVDGKITLDTEIKFLGPCLTGMQPGDEGSMVNGAFSKTDNINDPGNQ